ncbi:tachykinin isoform X1 [Megalopta genalis]|uniref:tachykinin isoform X1 n=2 Tax=Megalopta genalis TaxID=115081 RepID=UPI003FD15B61
MYKVKHAERQFIVVRHVEKVLPFEPAERVPFREVRKNRRRTSSFRGDCDPTGSRRADDDDDPLLRKSPACRTSTTRERMIVRSCLCLAATIALALADDPSSNNVLSVKDDPMSFEEMRGNKNFGPSEDAGIAKRAPMGFQGMRGKKDSMAEDIEHDLAPETADKRAPMGFQGTRGKKDSLSSDPEDPYAPGDAYEKRAYYNNQDEHYKRAPMGFQGTRGKKSLAEILNEIERRNTMGYQDEDTYLFDYGEDYDARTPSMTVGRFRDEDARDGKNEILDEWEKRAPMGFQGMRGKKVILDAVEQLEKRARMGGFHGMRGKKDSLAGYVDYPINPSEYAKRGTDIRERNIIESLKRTRMGFHGMRGKRDVSQIYEVSSSYQGTNNDRGEKAAAYEIAKRSPYRYVGVRGKKNPRWEFRGKFVGVRGKKSSMLQHRSVF